MSKPHKSFYKEGKGRGIFAWIFSTDHKRIGLLYLYSIMIFFVVGMVLGLLMKTELAHPGEQIMDAQTYNGVFTLHGIIMIFLIVIPGLPAVFGNFCLPLMLGAKDVAFPTVNLLSWWLYLAGAVVAVTSQFTGGGPPDTGWTFYAPYSFETGTNMLPAVIGAFLLGFSSILTGLNFVVTIHKFRAPGMTWLRMPLFPWALYGTGWIQILATPVIGITLLMLVAERVMSIGFFDPTLGGDPVLFQHLFWIYSHPVVYVMILPAFGAISEIVSTFSRKHIFGYKAMIVSIMAIAFVGYFVWGHHMYTAGMSEISIVVFSFITFLVAVPTAIKVFNWLATMYKGSIHLEPPFYWALSFIFLFLIGGLTGLVLGSLSTDVHVHDTQFIVAHFHYTVFGGTGFGFLAAMHYWYPKIYGRMYNKKVSLIGWAIMFIGFNVLYVPMFYLGLVGMPRRYYDYLDKFTESNMISSVGAFILGLGFFIVLVNFFTGAYKGKKVGKNPWGGKTLEWEVDSPPTLENFETEPVVTEKPYNY